MPSVADILRQQRQSIAAANLDARLQAAQVQVASALAGSCAATQPLMAAPDPSENAAVFRAKAEVERAIALAKEQSKPCPTGYARNASGDCAITIDTARGLPGRTEWMGPTLSQNREATSFSQPLNRSAPLPGQAYSTVLSGLGYGKTAASTASKYAAAAAAYTTARQQATTSTSSSTSTQNPMVAYCKTLRAYAVDLQAKIDANCALIAADNGATFDKAAALKVIAEINAFCKGTALSGLGALGFDLEDSAVAYRDLRDRYLRAMNSYRALESKYPNTRGACLPPCVEGISKREFSFSAVQGQAVPAAQSGTISMSGSGAKATAGNAVYSSGASNWIRVTVDSKGGFTVQPTSTNIAPGSYTAKVVISAGNACPTPTINGGLGAERGTSKSCCAGILVSYTVAAAVDPTDEYCVKLRKQRDDLMVLIENNCALLAADPATKATLYTLLNQTNTDLKTFCGKKSGWTDAKTLAGLGFDLEDYAVTYRTLRDRYLKAAAALNAAKAVNPGLVGRSCAYVASGQTSTSPINTPATSQSSGGGGTTSNVDVPGEKQERPVEEEKGGVPKYLWVLLAAGIGGFLYATKKK